MILNSKFNLGTVKTRITKYKHSEIDGSNFKIKESAHFSFLFRKKNEKGRSAVESLKSKHEMKWKHSESEKTGKKI